MCSVPAEPRFSMLADTARVTNFRIIKNCPPRGSQEREQWRELTIAVGENPRPPLIQALSYIIFVTFSIMCRYRQRGRHRTMNLLTVLALLALLSRRSTTKAQSPRNDKMTLWFEQRCIRCHKLKDTPVSCCSCVREEKETHPMNRCSHRNCCFVNHG